MYEDSWYSFVPDANKKDDGSSSAPKNRRESLLKQPTRGNQIFDPSGPIMDLYEDGSGPKGPPQVTLARRAKSYSDFYEVAVEYLNKEAKLLKTKDPLEQFEEKKGQISREARFEEFEDALLDASQEEYQLYSDQLALSERHLDTLLSDTSSSLDLLATLSASFKTVESETTAFQAQCEDLLAEQRRLRDLADDIGTELQYYAYLEPLTRRLNSPGAGRLVRADDFLDMLLNLNTCIDFMDQHPNYRDSTVYKTRYTSLLERALNLVQMAFSSALRDVSDEVSKQLKAKDHSETAEYVLLYGKYESILLNLGTQVEKILRTDEFAFGQTGDETDRGSYIDRYHELFNQLIITYLKSREPVGPLVLKNLKKLLITDPKPEADFESFARRSIQYVLDVCQNEQSLVAKFFSGGPLLREYPKFYNKHGNYSTRLDENIFAHLTTLHTFLAPYISSGDLERVCNLVSWLETTYLSSNDADSDIEESRDDQGSVASVYLRKHLWPLLDTLFLRAATEIEHFRPAPEDLKVDNKNIPLSGAKKSGNADDIDAKVHAETTTPQALSAYPTVKAAVKLLVMYNEGSFDRIRSGDVLYEIVHQTTESLQKAATTIKRTTSIMNAQLFLIKNLMLIENLFMTQEIPEVVRSAAEFDFTPIWDTIQELQDRKQLFNPLAYITPLYKGKLLPAVVDRILDARKELEKVLVQQITMFTKTWQPRLADKDYKKREAMAKKLETLLNTVFDDETTRAALWKMIRAEE